MARGWPPSQRPGAAGRLDAALGAATAAGAGRRARAAALALSGLRDGAVPGCRHRRLVPPHPATPGVAPHDRRVRHPRRLRAEPAGLGGAGAGAERAAARCCSRPGSIACSGIGRCSIRAVFVLLLGGHRSPPLSWHSLMQRPAGRRRRHPDRRRPRRASPAGSSGTTTWTSPGPGTGGCGPRWWASRPMSPAWCGGAGAGQPGGPRAATCCSDRPRPLRAGGAAGRARCWPAGMPPCSRRSAMRSG